MDRSFIEFNWYSRTLILTLEGSEMSDRGLQSVPDTVAINESMCRKCAFFSGLTLVSWMYKDVLLSYSPPFPFNQLPHTFQV